MGVWHESKHQELDLVYNDKLARGEEHRFSEVPQRQNIECESGRGTMRAVFVDAWQPSESHIVTYTIHTKPQDFVRRYEFCAMLSSVQKIDIAPVDRRWDLDPNILICEMEIQDCEC